MKIFKNNVQEQFRTYEERLQYIDLMAAALYSELNDAGAAHQVGRLADLQQALSAYIQRAKL